MIPPLSESHRFSNSRSQLSKLYDSLNRVSADLLPARFTDIMTRDSSRCGLDVGLVRGVESVDP